MSDWILSVVEQLGAIGVGLLILLENVVPPVPSELILPLAGFEARNGTLNPIAVWFAATLASVAGAFLLYGLGRWLGYDRLRALAEKPWFILTSTSDLEKGSAIFRKHGPWVVAAARCVPVLRSVVSIPAGLVGMPLLSFGLLSALGAGVWNALFITAGWVLAERWQDVAGYTGPISVGVIAAIVVGMVVLAVRRWRSRSTASD